MQVNDSIGFISAALGIKPKLEYTGGNKGWVGDNPFIFLDTKKVRATGWKTTLTIEQSIMRTLRMAPAKPVGARTAMKIVVQGLWHLGCVTAACCAKHFPVVGLGVNAGNIAKLNEGQAPLFEPGLERTDRRRPCRKKLSFTTDAKAACADADVLWVCMDTPVDDNDESDVDSTLAIHRQALAHLPKGALVLISSQLPVGTCAKLEEEFPQFHFACSPENLRLGKAIDSFEKAERVVVGTRDDAKKAVIEELFAPFTPQILFMRTESAEMVEARAEFVSRAVHHLHQRNCAPLRTHRRGREGSFRRPEKRAAHRAEGVSRSRRAVRRRHARA